ncbi:Protein of unknown function [Bacillus cereus]|uniref:Uncharacterized protein n=1 Tax=Bacillus wiedmannii TaxID=1890302 RepID=A0AB37YMQ8_9BACI|nr:Protein of unknown function [Bacillus mobilis]SCB99871.1 Protein of unknown function [Bacillus wiedmannii]SCM85996.1 Protein of unknown function [Bacillus mycoides]SCN01789.1 Protein of unknown function [Bacillus wiedmannii]SCN43220.1 Protein of unknown function [Bacillus cereus]
MYMQLMEYHLLL